MVYTVITPDIDPLMMCLPPRMCNRIRKEHGVLLDKGVLLRDLSYPAAGLAPLGSQVNSAQADFSQAAVVCLLLLNELSQNHPSSVLRLQKAATMMPFEALNYYRLAPERRNKKQSSGEGMRAFSVVPVGLHQYDDDF